MKCREGFAPFTAAIEEVMGIAEAIVVLLRIYGNYGKTVTHPIYRPICARAGRVCQNVARVTFGFFAAAIK
ncbi:MAG: hypothetical protein LBQ18_01315 [Campylobacteraceae bacterium]|nr:hypothetical protein [Campylobacteraceae bacterium]